MQKEAVMSKVVLTDIIEALSRAADTSDALCSSFLKELFCLVSAKLAEGEDVAIKGIGTFKLDGDAVVFVPDDDIASAINSPFDCFEPVVLDDDVTDEVLSEEVCPAVQEEHTVKSAVGAVEAQDDDKNEEPEKEIMPPPIPEEDKLPSVCAEPEFEQRADEEPPVVDRPNADEDGDLWNEIEGEGQLAIDNAVYPVWKKWLIFLSGMVFGAVVGILVYVFCIGDSAKDERPVGQTAAVDTVPSVLHDDATESAVAETKEAGETLSDSVAVKQESAPIYYKVEKTSYLSNISRKYYGHYAFWIYIYIENKDKIKNPDNLPVGIVLEIPAPEKYGIDKNNPDSIYKAEKLAVEMFGE